ncbi:hypothetical protein EG68_11937 [Paragonimus skrjabini miyazakii]|uniref:Uncharacterized protein n=1 Tax=Paragonimus skrjabini miyazakii TaxID=59628 RepID=A0A8S9YDR2_9TREM|nr:hypothetical protein EG68_11937 [Paragonimus skrjabini miyazakii]
MISPSARLLLRRCMRETVGPQLVIEMSYAGGRKKIAFKDSTLRRAIEESILSQGMCPETRRDEVNKWMKCWFYNARDRGGRYRLRKQKTTIESTESQTEG